MEYFVSKNHNRLNGRPFVPELYSNKLCLNPKYNVNIKSPAKVKVLLDSGAFQDLQRDQRLTFERALTRQLDFEERARFESSFIVSYDRIVDESPTVRGVRKKRRVSNDVAERYVTQTIEAAKFLADHRRELEPRRLVLSNQGITPDQYIGCLKEVLRFAEPQDAIGFGGFCIIGQVPRYTSDFEEVLRRSLPLLRKKRIRRIHIFGVGVFKTLIKTHVMCHKAGITPSYDTSSLELNAVYGRVWKPDTSLQGPSGVHLTNVFGPKEKYSLYHPVDWALLNIEMVSLFWDRLNRMFPLPKDKPEGYG